MRQKKFLFCLYYVLNQKNGTRKFHVAVKCWKRSEQKSVFGFAEWMFLFIQSTAIFDVLVAIDVVIEKAP